MCQKKNPTSHISTPSPHKTKNYVNYVQKLYAYVNYVQKLCAYVLKKKTQQAI